MKASALPTPPRSKLASVDAVFGDVGYGDAVEYTGSILTPHELATKEAVTDALKRCLRNLGDQFGLCLYDKYAPEHEGRNGGAAGSNEPPSRSPAAPTHSGAAPTEKQLGYLRRLMEEKDVTDLGIPFEQLTKAECSKFIEQLKDGSFHALKEFAEVGATLVGDEDIPF